MRYADSFDARDGPEAGDIAEDCGYRGGSSALNCAIFLAAILLPHQIAGDLFTCSRTAASLNVEGTITTGMLAIGNWGERNAEKGEAPHRHRR